MTDFSISINFLIFNNQFSFWRQTLPIFAEIPDIGLTGEISSYQSLDYSISHSLLKRLFRCLKNVGGIRSSIKDSIKAASVRNFKPLFFWSQKT